MKRFLNDLEQQHASYGNESTAIAVKLQFFFKIIFVFLIFFWKAYILEINY